MLIFVLLTTMFTANDLKHDCASTDWQRKAWCLGYLTGFDNALAASVETPQSIPAITAALENNLQIMGCLPDGVTIEQTRLVFLKYAGNHPEQLHLSAAIVLSRAMVAAFPCRTDK